jgi:hypothetical protein
MPCSNLKKSTIKTVNQNIPDPGPDFFDIDQINPKNGVPDRVKKLICLDFISPMVKQGSQIEISVPSSGSLS